ncbi:Vitamin B12 dependent methionine synthase activation subunit [Desulforamulus reducens]|uniref:Vitamin B12 dependent methionine synthase activation subunit n=1 Tax=Desulforamulus reducens TaxID=59610 RepID=UPI0018DB3DA0|nr:Vitamin B12 dependent methionine synthase activation subunit [Desulforamulus reducens]
MTISKDKVFLYLGINDQGKVNSEMLEQIQQVIQAGRVLLSPTGILNQVPLRFHEKSIFISHDIKLRMKNSFLKNCTTASVVAVTVGETIDKEVAKLFEKGEATSGIILDAVGTVAVEEAADQVVRMLSQQMRLKGLFATPRLGPGYQGMPIECLPEVLYLAGGGKIKITTNEYYQMIPAKSLCFILGWSSQPSKYHKKCDFCHKTDCQYRS